MKLLRHPVASMIIFAVLIGLCINIQEAFEEGYGLTETDIQTSEITGKTGNIMEQLKSLNIISGITEIQNEIIKLKNPSATAFDIVGGLASVGIGTLKSVVGLVTLPIEIVGIIIEFYTSIPSILVEIVMLIVVYVGFILLSAYLRSDV